MGKEPNQPSARKPGLLIIIQYSLESGFYQRLLVSLPFAKLFESVKVPLLISQAMYKPNKALFALLLTLQIMFIISLYLFERHPFHYPTCHWYCWSALCYHLVQ